MTFKIFKKTGELRDRQGDWDGDEGCEEEIEISKSDVEKALVGIIVSDASRETLTEREHNIASSIIKRVIVDNGLFEELCENYADELNDWAQESAK